MIFINEKKTMIVLKFAIGNGFIIGCIQIDLFLNYLKNILNSSGCCECL